MSHEITWRENGIYRKFSNIVHPEEILQSNFATHEDPRFLEVDYIINDFIDIEKIAMDPEHSRIFASTDDMVANNREKKMKIAIVIQREYQPLAEAYRQSLSTHVFICKIFNAINDAEEWVTE